MKTGKWTELVEGDGIKRSFVVRNRVETRDVSVVLETEEPVTMRLEGVTHRVRWRGDYLVEADSRNVTLLFRDAPPADKPVYVVIYGPGCAP